MVFGKLLPRDAADRCGHHQNRRQAAAGLGIPVSTTHTITGAIFGVGSVRNAPAVRWGVAGHIVMAWPLTIPATALIAAVFYGVSRWLF